MERNSDILLTFILNSLWQVSIVAGLAAFVGYLIRRGPAKFRNLIWLIALPAALLSPIMGARARKMSTRTREPVEIKSPAPNRTTNRQALSPGFVAGTTEPPDPLLQTASDSRTTVVPLRFEIATPLLITYCIGLVVASGKLLFILHRTRRLLRTARRCELPPHLNEVWDMCKQAFGRSKVTLLCSKEIHSPAAADLWRPVVILPEPLLSEMSKELLTAALGHEMAHVMRRDFAQNFLSELLLLPVWFHPASLLIRRELRRTREMACDELVTSRLLESETYASSLLKMASDVIQRKAPAYGLGVFDGGTLERRIMWILQRPTSSGGKALSVMLILGASLVILFPAFAPAIGIRLEAQSTPRSEFRQSFARIVPFTAWRINTVRDSKTSMPPVLTYEVHAVRADGSFASRRFVYHSGQPAVNSQISLVPDRLKVLLVDPLRIKVTFPLRMSELSELTLSHTDPQCAGAPQNRSPLVQFAGYSKVTGWHSAIYVRDDKTAKSTHYYVPALNCYEIRNVTEFKNDSGAITSVATEDTISIARGEPDHALFAMPPGYRESKPSELYKAHAYRFLGGKTPGELPATAARLDALYIAGRVGRSQ